VWDKIPFVNDLRKTNSALLETLGYEINRPNSIQNTRHENVCGTQRESASKYAAQDATRCLPRAMFIYKPAMNDAFQ
jgi:hypothetical protein